MENATDRKIISDREQKEYLPECPVQVKRNTITEENGTRTLEVKLCPCTERHPLRCTLSITYTDARRVMLSEEQVMLDVEQPETLTPPPTAVYVHSQIETVWQGEECIWQREGREALKLPEQAILWQTDPLYEQICRECEGVVQPVFRPDTIEDGKLWRCTCGQINLTEATSCGHCHTQREWLDTHFDEAYLTEEKRLHDIEAAKNPKSKKANVARSKVESDRIKMITILSALGAALLLTILTVTWIVPSIRYGKAGSLVAEGEYDAAIEIYTDLGTFRDASTRAADATYRKAQMLTGLDEVYLTTSAAEPWYSITEDGVLSFRKDEYNGSWDLFIVPDMVDGVIVRELDKNFFLNCKDMVAVTLSDCLEVLGEQTFFNCESLTTVYFGKNLHTLGPRTFINCYALTEITIPDTITKIGLRAFNSCTSLRSVHLGSGITTLPSYLFSCCYSLERVSFGAPITAVEAFAFSECPKLSKLYYPGTEQDWNAVTIGEENAALDTVEIVYES